MPLKNRFSQVIGLSSLDVFIETPPNDDTYFEIEGLSPVLGYGKHGFRLTFKDPVNKPLLKNNSPIIFEFVDSQGEVVFSELSDIPDLSGAATAYIWIKKDPLRIANEISDGRATLYVVGELEGVPDNYKGKSNLRSSFTFNIRKDFPNTSPILFYDVDGLLASASFSESLELDVGSDTFARGYINVSSSHLQTQGGKVAFGELSFRETGSRTEEFTVLSQYPLTGNTTIFETSATGSEGTSPISHVYKTPIPRDIRRDTPVIFKLRFLDENKSPAKHYDANRVNQDIEVTSSVIVINGTPTIIEQEDNLLRGSMFTGQAVGEGFETSGRNSAFMKTVDYTGFVSASAGSGSGGIMFFSGSVLPGSGDDYQGVGLEMFANTESFFKFRSNPSELDVRAAAFFVGSEKSQFISASGGSIEISSSGFHLGASGNLTASNFLFAGGGTIGSDVEILADLTANQIRTPAQINGVTSTTANASSSITSQGFASFKSASIGGFKVNETEIKSTNEKIIFKSSGQISASSMLLSSGSFVVEPDNLTRFGGDDFASFFMANDTGVRIQTSNFNLNTQRFIISSSDVGVMAVGSTPPLSHISGSGFFVDGDGNFLVGKAAGPRIQFDGFNTIISSSNFLLGGGQQFISGSNGNIEISSSNFHLTKDGDVTMAGTITADAGAIGGFTIDDDEIKSGTNIALNSSTKTFSINNGTYGGDGIQLQFSDEIGRPRFHVGNGGSNFLKFDGTSLDVKTDAFFVGNQTTQFISGSNNIIEISSSNFHLSSSGDVVVAGNITATTGEIGGFTISTDALSSDNFFISGAATSTELFISSSGFSVDARGIVSASALSLTGGDVAGLSVREGTISVGEILKLKSSGQVTGSNVLFSGGTIGGFELSSTQINDTDDDLLLKSSGQITGSNVLFDGGTIGGFTIDSDEIKSGTNIGLDSNNKRFTIHDTTFGNTGIQLEHNGGTPRAFIGKSNGGFLRFENSNVVMSSSAFLLGDANNFISGSNGRIKITGSNVSIDTPTFFLGDSSNFVSGSNGELKIQSSGTTTLSGSGVNILTPNFFLGKKSTSFISSSADDLTIQSSGTTTLSGSGVNILTPQFFFGKKSTAFISGSNGNIEVSSSKFHIQPDGDVVMNNITASNANVSGKITANTGEIGGFTIGDDLSSGAGTLKLKGETGQITGSDVLFNGGVIGGFELSSTQINSTDDNLTLKSNGQITGSNVLFDGGKIAAFKLTDDALSTNSFFISASATDRDFFISSSKFQIRASGEITGSEALFSGGKIAGWTISGTTLVGANATLDGAGSALFKSDQGPGSDSTAAFDQLRDEYYIDFTPEQGATNSAGQFYVKFGPNFSINSDGVLFASGAQFEGTVSASKGIIGGFTTDNNSFSGTNIFISGSPAIGGVHHPKFMFISSSNFNVKENGDVSGSQVLFTGGKIGGYSISDSQFISNNSRVILDNSGTISVGTGTSGFGNANNIFLDGPNARVSIGENFKFQSSLLTIDGNATIGGFTISNSAISSSNDNLILRDSGQITGSTVLFTGGKIAGWEITSNQLRNSTNIILDSENKKISITDSTFGNTGVQLEHNDGTPRFHVGRSIGEGIKFDGSNVTISSSTFSLGNASNFISGANGDLRIFSTGETTLSGSQVTLETPRFFFGSPSQFISGSNNNIEISSSNFHLDRDGNVDMSGTVTAGAGAIGGFTINADTITATNFTLSPAGKFISLGSGDTIFIADADEGIQLGDATFADAPFSVTTAGVLKATSGTIGGFTLSSDRITSNNLIMDSDGILETADFAAGVKGWRISSVGNGEAEFENVKIRGTLATAVFEKETVNAVGGQLYVANSTALTGSGQISASNATMSVVNVGGFVQGEVLSLKKVSDTGFSTEYVLVNSASRDDNTSTTNFAGKLFVDRGYGGGTTGDSGSLGGTPANSQSYEPGQVIVSTGKEGTGYIRLNANPSDDATPFIDIVERTGSGIYDVDLKARLGDLSGLSTARLQGTSPSSAGFGLYSQNVFLEGGIIANTGSIAGIKMQSGKLFIGEGNHNNDDTAFFANSDGDFSLGSTFVWDSSAKTLDVSGSAVKFNTGQFLLGGGSQFVSGSSGNIEISSSLFHLDPKNNKVSVSGSVIASDGLIGGFEISSNKINSTNDALILSSDGGITGSKFLLQGGIITSDVTIEGDLAANSISTPTGGSPKARITSAGFASFISASIASFNIDTDTIRNAQQSLILSSSDVGAIKMGVSASSMTFDSGNGFFVDGGGKFLIGSASGHRMQFDGTDLILSSSKFFLGDRGQSFISGSGGILEISSSKFHLSRSGDVVISGDVTATKGNIGGFDIGANTISTTGAVIGDSSQGLFLSSSIFKVDHVGNVTASNVDLSGKITATSGEVGGFTIDADEIKSGTNIGLDSNNKKFTINDTTFGNTGIQLEHNSGNPRAFIGKSNGGFVKFDGGDVEISSSAFLFGQLDSQFISGSNGILEISSSKFHLSRSGDVVLQGDMTADTLTANTSGEIAGWSISSNTLTSNGGGIRLNGNGNNSEISINSHTFGNEGIQLGFNSGNPRFYAGDGAQNFLRYDSSNGVNIQTVRATISGSQITLATPKFFLGSPSQFISGSNGNIEISSSRFHLTKEGNITASNVNLSGKITAQTGTIGGFNIGTDLDSTSGTLKLKGASGQITASDAQISGNITATSGEIGGFTIDSDEIKSGTTFILDSDTNNGMLKIGASGGPGSATGTSTGVYLDGDGDWALVKDAQNRIFNDGTNLVLKSEDFSLSGSTTLAIDIEKIRLGSNATTTLTHGSTGTFLDKNGKFSFVQDANNLIKGGNSDFQIKSQNFSLSGSDTLRIDNERLRIGRNADLATISVGDGIFMDNNGNFRAGNATGSRIQYDGTDLILSSSKFFLGDGSNFVSGSNGKIQISSDIFDLATTTMILDSGTNSGKIALGSSPNANVGGTNQGVYMDGTGDFLIRGDANNFLKMDGTSVEIKAATFDLATSKLILDSGTNNGKISLGSTPSTDGTDNAGFYADGNGVVLIGDADSHRISFDGGNLVISSSTYFLGGASNFISASNDKLRIQSDNFSISQDGDVTMDGTISASAGHIGGFVINNNSISSSNDSLIFKGDRGEITASKAVITGFGKIGEFTMSGSILSSFASGEGQIRLDASKRMISVSELDEDHAHVFRANKGVQIAAGGAGDGFQAGPRFFAGDTGSAFIDFHADILEISSSKFHLSRSGEVIVRGDLTADRLIANTAGEIGGFTIDADEIKSTNLLLDSTNEKITVGSANAVTIQGGGTDNFITMGKSAFGQSTTVGAILGMDATVPTLELFKDASNSFIFNDSGVAIKADTFDLDASTLVLDSGTNNGKIALGATPPTNGTDNAGFYADGNGVVLIGNAGGKKISFDGTNVEISSSAFTLGDKSTAFISASGGQIEISSSNFHLTAGGAVTASGLLILSSSGIPIMNQSGNLVAGSVDGLKVADIKIGAERAKAVIDSDNKFQGDLGGSATLDGDAIADVKTGASRANNSIDASGNVTANVTGDINGTAASTIRTRAITSVSEPVVYTDSAQAGSSTDNQVSALPEYVQTGTTFKSKVVFLYLHNANNIQMNFAFLCKKSNSGEGTGFKSKTQVGILPVTASLGGGSFPGTVATGDFSNSTAGEILNSTSFTKNTNKLSFNGAGALTGGDLYEVHVQIRGGERSSTDTTHTMTGVVATVAGASS